MKDGYDVGYVWQSYEEVAEAALSLAKSLSYYKLYSEVFEGRKRKILMCQMQEVRAEQIVLTLALWHIGASIMSEAEQFRTLPEFHLLATTAEDLPRILELKKTGKAPNLVSVLLFDRPSAEDQKLADKLKINICLYDELIKEGKTLSDIPLDGSSLDDIAIIFDTSCGNGKEGSVMLTHYIGLGFIWNILTYWLDEGTTCQLYEDSYSIATFMIVYGSLCAASGVFFRSHFAPLEDDIQHAHPDQVAMHCSGYQAVYHKMKEYLNSLPTLDKTRIETALNKKIAFIRQNRGLVEPELDKELLPLRELLFGKNVKNLAAGGTPLPIEIIDTLKAISAVQFDIMYGQIELGMISMNSTGESSDCIGPPVKMRQVKLIDVPKMGYFTTDCTDGVPTPRGEVLYFPHIIYNNNSFSYISLTSADISKTRN